MKKLNAERKWHFSGLTVGFWGKAGTFQIRRRSGTLGRSLNLKLYTETNRNLTVYIKENAQSVHDIGRKLGIDRVNSFDNLVEKKQGAAC